MKRLVQAFALCLLLAPTAIHADSKNRADYPLRIRVLRFNQTQFYRGEYMEQAKGEGRADLFENGEAHAVDFTYNCDQKLKANAFYETYPAKWKKQGKELTVLMPVFGKPNAFYTCVLTADVKDYAYTTHDGKVGKESVEKFKAWMVKHNYDPEHDKEVPTKPDASEK